MDTKLFTIRQAVLSDAFDITYLDYKIFNEGIHFDLIFDILASKSINLAVVDNNTKQIVGFILTDWHNIIEGPEEISDFIIKEEPINKKIFNINSLGISEDYRNKGIGKQLLVSLLSMMKEQNIKKVILQVRESNEIAIKLYKKMEFIQVVMMEDYYPDGEDGILMIYKVN
jgi:[ribosomal protein S18]-alanine N-acetyltransferase